ncbi:MAG: elongation factor G, partial [Bacteroidales bacterium]|nr:elongation factor G [Bacteroidales bacterium]
VRVEPADEGVSGLQFEDAVKGGNVPKEYIPSVEKGFKEALQNGVLAGFNMNSMKVTLLDGSFHPVDSDALSFEICAKQAFREACKHAKPILLEPIMSVEVVTPADYLGDVIGDFNKRRGQTTGTEERGGAQVIKCKVPLSEMFGYVTVLRTITSGRATSTMEFSHYSPLSDNLAKEVIKAVKGS